MGLQNWSTTPANNATGAPNINMATGSAPSTVHPSVRQLMADVATWYADPAWLTQADTPTYITGTSFSIPANVTTRYSVGRGIQMGGPGGGTPYTITGKITASVYTSLTTITVAWNSGALDATVNAVALGILGVDSSTDSSVATSSTPVGTTGPGVGGTFTASYPVTLSSTLISTDGSSGAFVMRSGATTQGFWGTTSAYCFTVVNAANTITALEIDNSGNGAFAGNVTAYSDERLKKDWSPLSGSFLSKLASVKYGTFTRKDTGLRQVGVSAQSLESVMPEAVLTSDDGMKSVAYGNAALVACVELAKQVLILTREVDALKAAR